MPICQNPHQNEIRTSLPPSAPAKSRCGLLKVGMVRLKCCSPQKQQQTNKQQQQQQLKLLYETQMRPQWTLYYNYFHSAARLKAIGISLGTISAVIVLIVLGFMTYCLCFTLKKKCGHQESETVTSEHQVDCPDANNIDTMPDDLPPDTMPDDLPPEKPLSNFRTTSIWTGAPSLHETPIL